MSQGLNDSLIKITKGTGIAFVGILAGLFCTFICRVLIARYGLGSNYGIFSLALVVLNIAAIIAALGLPGGASRNIAYYRGKGDTEKVQEIISASIQFTTVTSILLCLIFFFASRTIALNIFHEPALSNPLRVFAIGIPFFALLYIFISIFRGFDIVKVKVYFQDILIGITFLLLVVGILVLHLSFNLVFYAYLASLIISCALLAIYTIKRLPLPIRFTTRLNTNPSAKALLIFSLPLLGTGIFMLIMAWMDTLMLGYFKSSEVVGIYNAALPLARFISTPINAMELIYMPVISGLYAQSLMPEIRRTYTILTKWIFSITLPLFLIMFLFPETVLNFVFGVHYISAASVLTILSLGFIINNLLGPNSATLLSMGKSRFIMWSAIAGATLNIILNIILIPPLGIVGAAIATVASIVLMDIIRLAKVYSLSRAFPLSKNLLKPAMTSVGLIFLIYFICRNFISVTFWMLPILLILFYMLYTLLLLITKSFDQEDITMLLAIEKRTGVNAEPIKKIIRRFL